MDYDEQYLQAFFQMVDLLTSGSVEIGALVKEFVSDPKSYRDSHYGLYCCFEEDDLEDLTEFQNAFVNTYLWDVFYGVMATERFIIKLDYRTSPEDICWAVDTLLSRKGRLDDIKTQFRLENGRPTWENLHQMAVMLQDEGLVLANINDGSDSFILFIVEEKVFFELLPTSLMLEFDIQRF